jgi:hypothetical protein
VEPGAIFTWCEDHAFDFESGEARVYQHRHRVPRRNLSAAFLALNSKHQSIVPDLEREITST